MDESSDDTLYVDMNARIATTHKLFTTETRETFDNFEIAGKKKVAFSTEVEDDGATIIISNVQEDDMSII